MNAQNYYVELGDPEEWTLFIIFFDYNSKSYDRQSFSHSSKYISQ